MTEDKQDTMVSTKEVIELCDRLLSQGRGKKKSLEFIKTKMQYKEKDNLKRLKQHADL